MQVKSNQTLSDFENGKIQKKSLKPNLRTVVFEELQELGDHDV